ncbi:hypothetical protein SDC9_174212 [bioreactor metagenome]|uniref:Uncharacterized protein n=1 Tax=bioreactor metagenome TaxID=1076179 RepID=A0A645GIS6_9ZZZZ
MLRFDIDSDGVTMAGSCAYDVFVESRFPHQFLPFDAVLFRIKFKVKIVQQTNIGPESFLFTIAQFAGKVAHHTFYSKGMAQVKRILVIFGK